MNQTINIIQIVLAIFLTASILLQHRGTGLGGAFGGEGNVYRTRRGAEKTLFVGTIVLAALFILTAIVNILLK